MICFPTLKPKGGTSTDCEFFDGSTVTRADGTNFKHTSSCMGLYNNQPTAVGCWVNPNDEVKGTIESDCVSGKVETLTPNGWEDIADHPE